MDTIRLGKTEIMIPRLGFGGIPIQRLAEDDAVAVVRKCIDLGITSHSMDIAKEAVKSDLFETIMFPFN